MFFYGKCIHFIYGIFGEGAIIRRLYFLLAGASGVAVNSSHKNTAQNQKRIIGIILLADAIAFT